MRVIEAAEFWRYLEWRVGAAHLGDMPMSKAKHIFAVDGNPVILTDEGQFWTLGFPSAARVIWQRRLWERLRGWFA